MAYVAVKGGTEAIEHAIERLKYERIRQGTILDVQHIEHGLRGLIDQVMSESSLYDETLAALAIKQSEGNPEEAVFLLRAYRSTLPRKHYSRVATTAQMDVERRISAAFKDIPGGQLLGATVDYMHRLLDFSLLEESLPELARWREQFEQQSSATAANASEFALHQLPRVIDLLRKEGLMASFPEHLGEPDDVTRESLQFPSTRSQRLQVLTRGQTGAVTALGYAVLRGYGALHPAVGELRVGQVPITINHPLDPAGEEEDAYYIGDIKLTEAEMLIPHTVVRPDGKNELEFVIGYGICYGQNETKAIAMGILDNALETPHPNFPPHDEEFVLYHIDCVEATGFISHLKMPHYVTFQSDLERVRHTKVEEGKEAP